MTAATLEVRLLVASGDDVGESPVWDHNSQCLWWTDIAGHQIQRWDSATGELESRRCEQEIGFIAPRIGGGWIVGARDGIARLHGSELRFIHPIDSQRGTHRINDGKADVNGRLWFGTMAFEATVGSGALHRLDLDGTRTVMLDGLTIPNGLGWSGNGCSMYFIESTWRRIDRFGIDPVTGDIVDRDVLVDLSDIDGLPDGLCVDADDHVWVAMWGGSHVRRIRPDGSLDLVVPLPASQPANICIGGSSGRQAFVTTAAHMLTADQARAEGAGHVYTFDSPALGVPAHGSAVG